MAQRPIRPSHILSTSEIRTILEAERVKAAKSINAWQNLIVFRLSTCCGLRAGEIATLRLVDVRLSSTKPKIRLRRKVTKRHRPREVPLWWDANTLTDMRMWRQFRAECQGAEGHDPFICKQIEGAEHTALDRLRVRARFLTACRSLGPERASELTCHSGRHSYISHMLKHHTIAEVQQAVGHQNIATTSLYVHIAVEDDGTVQNVFEQPRATGDHKPTLPMQGLAKLKREE